MHAVRIRRGLASPIAVLLLAGGGISAAAVSWWAAPASASTIHVSDEASFRAAFNSNANDTIVLDADIHLTSATGCSRGTRTTANNPLTVDGQGQFKIVQDCPGLGVLSVLSPNTTNLTLRGLTVTGGNDAGDGGGLEFEAGTLTVDHSTFLNNAATSTTGPPFFFGSDGGGIDFEGHSAMTVTDSTFSGNSASDDGGAINCDSGGATASRTITISRSTFIGNSTVAGLGNSGGAIDMENSDPCALTLTNSTITQNTSGDDAAVTAEFAQDTISLVYSSIVNNATAPASPGAAARPAGPKSADNVGPDHPGGVHSENNNNPIATANVEISTPANLTLFGTVIARPHGGPNCSSLTGTPLVGVASAGYNFADDTSCALTGATDKQGAGLDPFLGAPASNGGPTQTLLPQLSSPLIDAIPAAACQSGPAAGVTTDQRGVVRPQGSGCDIGAVELEVIRAIPRFTG